MLGVVEVVGLVVAPPVGAVLVPVGVVAGVVVGSEVAPLC